jgi:hypothetical protein
MEIMDLPIVWVYPVVMRIPLIYEKIIALTPLL